MRKKGGLITYVEEKFTINKRNLYTPSIHWEGLFIDIMHDNLPQKITIGNIYRPPRDNNSNKQIEYFLVPISSIIEEIAKENSNVLCSGDYNIDLLKLEDRQKFQEYFDLFLSKGIIPQITLPTRFSKRNATLIDQVFCKLLGKNTNVKSGIFVNKISDHLPCFTYFDMMESKNKIPKFVKIRVNTEEALTNFKNYLKESLTNMIFESDVSVDPNITYDKLDNLVQLSKDKFLPIKTVKFRKYKH